VNKDGRVEVLAQGTHGALWHAWQTTPGGSWSDAADLGGSFTGQVSVATNADGRLEAFARGTDGALWHDWQTTPGGSWNGVASLGGGLAP
jgi:acylphosphatase